MHAHSSALRLWLNLQCQMIANTAQAVLIEHTADSRNHIVAKWPDSTTPDAAIADAARQVITKQRTHLASEDNHLLLGQPVVVDERLWGAVVLRLDNRDQAAVAAALKLLKWGMTWLQFLLYQQINQQLAPLADQQVSQQLQFAGPANVPTPTALLSALLKDATLAESAITAVNQLASQLKAQRVSLGLYSGRHLKLQAVSYSANFDPRTRTMQCVVGAMTEALDQRSDVAYPPDNEQALVLRNHEQLQQESHSAHIHTFVLRHGKRAVGAITVENVQPLAPVDQQFVEQCLPALAALFHLKQQAAASGWRRARTAAVERMHRWWGREHWLGKAVTAACLAFLLLLLLPADYQVTGEAVLQSTEKRVLVANQSGYLAQVNARPGDLVAQGDVLAQMDDDDLRLERRKLASQLQQYRQEYDNALATAQRAEAAIASAQVEQASVQLQLVEQQLERTHLKSPMDGIIVSDDISQSVGAPVQQGDVLFEVAATDGYRVVLYVDEREVGHVDQGAPGKLVLTSMPGRLFQFAVARITPISEVRDGRNYFRVEGALATDYDVLRPGMTGSGKINAGRRPLGWIWFHGMIDWIRLTLWV